MASKASLSNAEIEEEIVNNDLINSGGLEDEETLQRMNLEEKKELLEGIKKSVEQSKKEPADSPISPSMLDTANFPSLPGRSGTNPRSQKPGLKLPRRLSSGVSSGGVINLLDDDEDDDKAKGTRFCLPGCQGDGAAPLKMPERPMLKVDNPTYRMEGETMAACLRRMLQFHDGWKRAYETALSKIESNNLADDLEDEDEIKASSKKEAASDIYEFHSNSPLQASKTYSPGLRNKTGATSTATTATPGSGPRQRRSSSDNEVDVILKPEESKMGDWIMAGGRQKNKRNKKTTAGEQAERDKSKEVTVPDVDFSFNEKWDSRSSQWQGTSRGQSPGLLNNSTTSRRSLGHSPMGTNSIIVEEEGVQCPICQKAFPRSKVENHAANCEGYSGDPMDVEEGN